MNTKSKLFSDWSEVTSGERNEIVFERLNKTYGAYEIRTGYDRTLLKAFFYSGAFIMSVSLALLIAGSIPAEIIIPDTNTIYEPFNRPDDPLVPKTPEQPVSKTSSQPLTDTEPEVKDDPEKDPENILPKNPNINNAGPFNPSDTGTTFSTLPTGGGSKPFEDDTVTYPPTAIQELPRFPGGDDELFRFLKSNMYIPETIRDMGKVKAKMGVTFVIDKDGSVKEVALVQGSKYSELNNEALRLVKKMPVWEPGRQNGLPVKVRLNLPISVTLN